MEQPLGRAIGNALEIRECIEFLKGDAPEDLETISIALRRPHDPSGWSAPDSMDQASKLAYEAVSKGAGGRNDFARSSGSRAAMNA